MELSKNVISTVSKDSNSKVDKPITEYVNTQIKINKEN